MNRLLLLACLAVLSGCPKNSPASSPDGNSPEQGAPQASSDAGALPVVSPDEEVEAVVDPAPPPGGGRMAKPGWCNKDNDCPNGQVCEKCGPEGACVPGCHTSDQCQEGEYCNQVQCIRCPCPGICELRLK